MAYFVAILEVFVEHRVSIRLRKTRFLPSRAEFVGLDLLPEGNSPASSKFEAIQKLARPMTFGDLHMLIGLFGFYSKWIPWYEDLSAPWRAVIKKKPPVDTPTEEEERLLNERWGPKEDSLIHVMKDAILLGPVLERPNWNRPFCVKTDWSSLAKGAVLCQPECTPEAEAAIKKQLAEGSPNEFDKTISGLWLRPLQFLSKMNSVAERSHHSSVGEWATARWAFSKWKKYLWFKPFDWMTDCIGITKFWDIDLIPTHQCQ